MSIRALADFNGAPWAVRRLAGTATVTVQGPRSGTTRRARGEDFYLATSGDLHLAISEDFPMAMDKGLPGDGSDTYRVRTARGWHWPR